MAERDYDVGHILVKLETQAQNISGTLDTTIKKLSELKRVVNGISNLNTDKVQKNLEAISKINFDNIVNGLKPLENLDTKSISSFVRQMKNITNINFDNVDFQKLYGQFNAMTRIIDPFIQKIISAEPSLRAFSNAIDLGRVNAQLSVAEARIKAINQSSQSKKVIDDIKTKKATKIYLFCMNLTKKYRAHSKWCRATASRPVLGKSQQLKSFRRTFALSS